MAHQESVSLTAEQLKDLIATAVSSAVAAAKQPNVIEQQELDARAKEIADQQENRRKNAQEHIQALKDKRWMQENCTHSHPDGHTHCVWIQEKSGPGYMICQLNQCVIRPGEMPSGYKGTAIFNTKVFNETFQKMRVGELFG